MSAPDNIKTLADAMVPDETAMQAACRFLRERDEYATQADLLRREVRRLSYAVENKVAEIKRLKAGGGTPEPLK